jgi:hypothetical protein
MMKLKLIGAAAVLSAACAAPVMAQEATQEPGTIGFNYPNSHYMTGGYGVHLPYNTGKYPRLRGDFAYVGPSYVVPRYYAPGVRVGAGPVGVGVGPGYDAYGYDPY